VSGAWLARRRPQYGADNEDTRSERRALRIQPSDTVVAVCAGGGRVLGLLAGGAQQVIAVDRAADQLHQLELKAAAADALDRAAFLAFLGITEREERADLYAGLRGSLSEPALRYWDRRLTLLQQGIFWAGRTERGLVGFVRLLRATGRMGWAQGFFDLDSVAVQQALLDAHAERIARGVRWCGRFGHPAVAYLLARDPGFLRSTEGGVPSYLAERLLGWLRMHPVRESFLLWMAYYGGLSADGPLPDYLTAAGYDAMRKQLDRLELRCLDLRREAIPVAYDQPVKWSLSDVGCWMSEPAFAELVRRVASAGAPGSRFCFRNFAARRRIPVDLSNRVRRLGALCDDLDATDRSVFFRFEVGELR
jgi:S-adenosylmethionine-diacylglycerol 3-amino-3-carboxypropyl transferase